MTLELDRAEDEIWGCHRETGMEKFELLQEGNKKILYLLTNHVSLYSMSTKDLQAYYRQSEIDYARIIVTVSGESSLGF